MHYFAASRRANHALHRDKLGGGEEGADDRLVQNQRLHRDKLGGGRKRNFKKRERRPVAPSSPLLACEPLQRLPGNSVAQEDTSRGGPKEQPQGRRRHGEGFGILAAALNLDAVAGAPVELVRREAAGWIRKSVTSQIRSRSPQTKTYSGPTAPDSVH